jgi:Protein of unknown function (DUF3592)
MKPLRPGRRLWLNFELVLVLALAIAICVAGTMTLWPSTFGSGRPIFSNFAHAVGIVQYSDVVSCRNSNKGVKLDVRYEYFIAGKKYAGTKLMHDECWRYQREWMEEMRAALRQGTSVSVYYNPNQPEYAVLRKDFPSSFVAGPVILSVGLICLVLIIRSRVRMLRRNQSEFAHPSPSRD